MPEEPGAAYDRGVTAGGIAERLASHDRHFETINGSLERVAEEMHKLRLAVQRLGDQAISDATTRVTTAAALKDAEEARRSRTETAWSPIQKILAVLAGFAVLVGAVVGIVTLVRGR
jgi:hypothetical protein